jgi:hypothetical protein
MNDGTRDPGPGRGRAALARFLGPMRGEHLSARELVELAAGADGAAPPNAHLAACAECRALLAAARAGLGEISKLERPRLAAPIGSSLAWHHGVAPVEAALAPRAAASTSSEESDPFPEARRVLLECSDPPLRVVLFRRGGALELGLFGEAIGSPPAVRCELDEELLAASSASDDGVSFALGPSTTLVGRTVVLTLEVGGEARRFSWTLVEGGSP